MGVFHHKSKDEIRERTLDQIVSTFKKAVREQGVPTPISLISIGSFMTDEFGPRSDVDLHVVYPEEKMRDEEYREYIGKKLADTARQLTNLVGREVHFWQNPLELYTTRRRFFGEPNEDHMALDGWDGLASDYLRTFIKGTGRTLFGTNLLQDIPIINQFPIEQAHELFLVSVMDLARGLSGNSASHQNKLAKGILRMQAAIHMANTGEALINYADIRESARDTRNDWLVDKAYVAKVVAHQDLGSQLRHWASRKFRLSEWPSRILRHQQEAAIYFGIEARERTIPEVLPDRERLISEIEHQRTAFRIIDLIVGKHNITIPPLFFLLDNELIAYAGITDLERDWKEPYFKRDPQIIDTCRQMIERTLADDLLLKKYRHLEGEIARIAAYAYASSPDIHMESHILNQDLPDDTFLANIATAFRIRGKISEALKVLRLLYDQYPESIALKRELLHGASYIFDIPEGGERLESFDPENIRMRVLRIVNSEIGIQEKLSSLAALDPSFRNPFIDFAIAYTLFSRGSQDLNFQADIQRLTLMNTSIHHCLHKMSKIYPNECLSHNFNRSREIFEDCARMFILSHIRLIETTYGVSGIGDAQSAFSLTTAFLTDQVQRPFLFSRLMEDTNSIGLPTYLNHIRLFAAAACKEYSAAEDAFRQAKKGYVLLGDATGIQWINLGYAFLNRERERYEAAWEWADDICEEVPSCFFDEDNLEALLFKNGVLLAHLAMDMGDDSRFHYAIDFLRENKHFQPEWSMLKTILAAYASEKKLDPWRDSFYFPEPKGGVCDRPEGNDLMDGPAPIRLLSNVTTTGS